MRRQLIYAVFVLVLLATAGPLLALALGEATRLLGDGLGDRLFAGILIVTMILLLALVIVRSVTLHNWPSPRRQNRLPDIELHSSAADVDLETLQAELDREIVPSASPEHQPKDFSQRLAGYLHCDQEQLVEPRPYPESKMSFWSRVGRLRWMGPKPAYLIRRLLERIREQVRGRAH